MLGVWGALKVFFIEDNFVTFGSEEVQESIQRWKSVLRWESCQSCGWKKGLLFSASIALRITSFHIHLLSDKPLFTRAWYGRIFSWRVLLLLDRGPRPPSTPLSTWRACSRALTIRLIGWGQALSRRLARDLGSICRRRNLRALPSGVSGMSVRQEGSKMRWFYFKLPHFWMQNGEIFLTRYLTLLLS